MRTLDSDSHFATAGLLAAHGAVDQPTHHRERRGDGGDDDDEGDLDDGLHSYSFVSRSIRAHVFFANKNENPG